jgi:hypothetical protein
MKMTLKIKINPIRLNLGLILHPLKPSAGLFILIKSRETIPLKMKVNVMGFGKRHIEGGGGRWDI